MKTFPLIALTALVAVAGCVHSLHGIYTDQDLVFKPALVGRWSRDPSSNESWSFTRHGEKGYRLLYSDRRGRTGRFVVHLARIGERLFLDLYPEKPKPSENDFYKWHFLSAHTFFRVELTKPTLTITALNYNWLRELLEKEPGAIPHAMVDRKIVLTASSKDLQAFLIKHSETEGAFGKSLRLTRQTTQTLPTKQ